MLVLGVGLTVLAIQEASRWTWTSPLTWSVLSVGLVLAALFVRAQLRSDSPLVNVRLLERRPFLADNVVMGLVQFGLLPVVLFNSLYVQDILGFSPIQAGLASLPVILPITVAAQIGGRWFDRYGVRRPVLIGLSVCTVGLLCWTAAVPTLTYCVAGAGHDLDRLRSRPHHLPDQHRRAESRHSGGAGPGVRNGRRPSGNSAARWAWPW